MAWPEKATGLPSCRVCAARYKPFASFGRMLLANGFLTTDQIAGEYMFDLAVGYCPNCTMVQLVEQPDREQMFNDSYAYFASTSTGMTAHFEEFAEDTMARHLRSEDPFVVELGSNDGIMLQKFARAGIRHLGVEPSANVAQVAMDKGIATLVAFFDEGLARRIAAEHGQADAVLGGNVMCHIPYLHSVAAGVGTLLKPDGVLVFEDPYVGDIVEKTSYDQIYDEHVFYFSVSSVSAVFERHGLEVVDVSHQDVHGGSMRYVIARKAARRVSSAVTRQRERESELGLDRLETYEALGRDIERSGDDLSALLRELKGRGKRVVGYGATSKSTTVTNYCGITSDLVEFISDTTPIKQGKVSPGAHIPVRPYEEFVADYPDYALLFAWNHAKEIMGKEQTFLESGGKWIVFVPRVRVLD